MIRFDTKVFLGSLITAVLFATSFFVAFNHPSPFPAGPCIMSFNIRCETTADSGTHAWGFRRSLVADMVMAHKCDFIGMQEVFPDQYRFLADELHSLYDSVYLPRDGVKDEGVPIFFLKANWTATENGTFWLSDTPDRMSNFPGHGYRIATWVRLQRNGTNDSVIVLNSHFDPDSEEARTKSSRLILQELEKIKNGTNAKVVMTGDLNATPKTEEVSILSTGMLRDTARKSRKLRGRATYHDWKGIIHGDKIDYVFLSEGFERVAFKIERRARLLPGGVTAYPSDHFPVIAVLKEL